MRISEFVVWYFVLQGLALAGLPLAFAWLRRLPTRGYAASKALGLLFTGVIFWWGGVTHLWGNTASAILVAAAILLGTGLWVMRGRWHELGPWLRAHRAFVITAELLFFAAFAVWTIVRSTQPQLETAGGEKWMEIAFLNANLRTPDFPPHDPWLSGYAISYYYLGYLLMAVLTRLTGTIPTVAFNLANAAWFALVAVVSYGILYDLLPRRDAGRPLLAPLLLLLVGNGQGFLQVLHSRGLFSAKFWTWIDVRGVDAAPQPPFSWVPQNYFWWWSAARTLRDYTPWGDPIEIIDEFPAFSFILGDMHPHLLGLPFALLAIVLALNLYHRGKGPAYSGWWSSLKPRFLPLLGYAVVLGALGFLNTWDLPIYWALFVGAMVVTPILAPRRKAVEDEAQEAPFSQLEEIVPEADEVEDELLVEMEETVSAVPAEEDLFSRLWDVIPEALLLGVMSILLYLPFWIGLRSQAGGVLPNLFHATRPVHFVVMFLPLIVPVAGLVINAVGRSDVRWRHVLTLALVLILVIAVASLLVGAAAAYPYLMIVLRGESVQGITLSQDAAISALVERLTHPWVGLVLAIGAAAALMVLDAAAKREPRLVRRGLPFPLLLALIGILLTLAPEFVYLKDVFMNRMNTIFKFYFQAWVFWSLAGAWQLSRWLEPDRDERGKLRFYLLAGVSALLIGAGLTYTLLAAPARAREHGAPGTLDGAAWLAEQRPADYLAINWLNTNVAGRPVILEAPGDNRSYVYEGRVSALTGMPTVLGWAFHEKQWRGTYTEQAQRERDLAQLFQTTDLPMTRMLLAKYDVAYVYLGPLERSLYPEAGLEKFGVLYPAVYDRDGVTIYQVSD